MKNNESGFDGNAALRRPSRMTDEELCAEFQELVVKATDGDGPAVGAILIAFGPTLMQEAREELAASRWPILPRAG
jgi:hypothetical protein